MAKPRLNRLSLKILLLLSVGLITLVLPLSCDLQGWPPPTEPTPTSTTAEATPTPTEAPPTEPTPTPSTSKPVSEPDQVTTATPQPTSTAPMPAEEYGFQIFMRIDGVPGESTDDRHSEWIEVLSYSHGLSQPGSGSVSSGGARTAERCEHSDFTIVKTLDKASPQLALSCCNGTHIREVTVELCRATGDKQKYMEYHLEDVIIASVSPSGSAESGEARPLEEVSFSYGRIMWTYTETDPRTGAAKGDVSTHWDLVANKGG